jgi:hypothetical protein
VDDGAAGVVDQVEEVAEIGAKLINPGGDVLAGLLNLSAATPGFLVHDLDRVFDPHHVAPELVALAADRVA